MNELAKHLIKQHEGLRLEPYMCPAGKLTIGYGRNLEDNGISKEAAEFLLDEDLQIAENEIKILCIRNGVDYNNLDEVRQAVLLDMIFNLGMARLGYFKKMFRALSEGDYYKASAEMLDSLWAAQVKSRAIKLAQMMKDGDLNVAS